MFVGSQDSALKRLMQKITDSQKDKNKYHVLTHIYGISKNGTIEYICRVRLGTQMKNRLVDTQGKERVIYAYLWQIHIVWQKPTQYCKGIIFQLKTKQSSLTLDQRPSPDLPCVDLLTVYQQPQWSAITEGGIISKPTQCLLLARPIFNPWKREVKTAEICEIIVLNFHQSPSWEWYLPYYWWRGPQIL